MAASGLILSITNGSDRPKAELATPSDGQYIGENKNMDSVWDRGATKQLIFDIYGKNQMLLARDSLLSMVERAGFASFHILEATRRWNQHCSEVKELPMGEILAPMCEDRKKRHGDRLHEIGAHVQACVQSIHSIADILSHALYYGLAMDRECPLNERNIDYRTVAEKLAGDQSLLTLRKLFESIAKEGEFKYLEALNNHGKHRSIVTSAVWFHVGAGPKTISLEFLGFKYSKTQYEGRPVLPFLVGEYERIHIRMNECGNELHNILLLRR
ncbi:hypothetical protein ACXX82_24110 [Glaciimonas sp. GNP009]